MSADVGRVDPRNRRTWFKVWPVQCRCKEAHRKHSFPCSPDMLCYLFLVLRGWERVGCPYGHLALLSHWGTDATVEVPGSLASSPCLGLGVSPRTWRRMQVRAG